MGRVRVAGLAFSLEYLRSEIQAFRDLMEREGWTTRENNEKRTMTVTGLTFIMLNLSRDEDEKEAWSLFHSVMDEYHDLCDRHHLTY
jgi:hypothetical protein